MSNPSPLAALRQHLAAIGLDGFVVPRADEHQGEYVPASAMRLAWVTGFSGSAGQAVVLADRAALFVDGRYTLQAGAEVDAAAFDILHLIETPPPTWLAQTLRPGHRLGFDPWLHTADQADALARACDRAGAHLVAVQTNPVDQVWTDRPAAPQAPFLVHDIRFAGRDSAAKRQEIADALAEARTQSLVLTDPASIAWTLNIRGQDVDYVPVPLAFAIVHADATIDLFANPAKLTDAVRAHLGDQVRLHGPADFAAALAGLSGRVRVDKATAPAAVHTLLSQAGAIVDSAADPCAMPRACKNAAELAGSRAAHLRDGVAMVRFLAWLDRRTDIDELGASDHLEHLRAQGQHYRGLSFPTIAGAGPNAAIVHYRSGPATNRPLVPGNLFLVDSGAQYLDGTTDVTRTIAVGEVGDEERERFTLVLKGHIAIARAVFPPGTTGSQLDVLARQALWARGLDYDHGTGHGVGSFLSVHEGPQRISKSGVNAAELRPGMIVSNEPGYYKAGAYGIRIEALVAVTHGPAPLGGERPLLAFETLTLVPIDRRLVDVALLDEAERTWVDVYHARVAGEIGPLVDAPTRAWLEQATRPLA